MVPITSISTKSFYSAEYPECERDLALSSLRGAIERFTADPRVEVVSIDDPTSHSRTLNGTSLVGYRAVVRYNRRSE